MPADESSSISDDQEGGFLEGQAIQPWTEQWYNVGGKLLQESIEVGREYSKFMIQFSFGAIPIYIIILKLVRGESTFSTSSHLSTSVILFIIPIVLFLICSSVFIGAYYPKREEVLLTAVEGIESTHQSLIQKRNKINLIGTAAFMISILISVTIIIS